MAQTDVLEIVEKFLLKANRPYAIHDILSKCDQKLERSAVQKALDSLVESEQLTVKQFGKAKIYFARQRTDMDNLEEELRSNARQLAQTQVKKQQKAQKHRELIAILRDLPEPRSFESYDDERDGLYIEIRRLRNIITIQKALEAEKKLTIADVKNIQKRHYELIKIYRERKGICMSIVDAIMEDYPKPKKMLIQDIGLVTDEAAGFALITRTS